MAFPTVIILGLLASSFAVITCNSASHASKIYDDAGESESTFDSSGNLIPTYPITEMSNRNKGKVVKKFTCPAIYGRYPHPESCEYYFECRFGWPTLWHCNRGYLYDKEKEQCRDKKKVNCHIGHERDHDHHKDNKDKDRDNKDKEIDFKEGDFKCPYIWGSFAHPKDCSKYYVCIYNLPKLFQCYKNFLYDSYTRKCLPSQKVKCDNRLDRDQMRTSRRPMTTATNRWKPITTVKPETTADDKNGNFHCPFPYGRYADPEDCSRFYECRFSIAHLHTCPESTLYHERKEQCLDQKKVKCGSRPGGNDEDVESEDDKNVSFRCPYVWGTFAHPVDCSKYIVCVYNIPTIFNCRKHELFDSYLRRCISNEKVTCGDRINPDDPSEKTTVSEITSTLIPSTVKKLPEPTTTTTITTSEPTTTTTTPEPTTTTTTPEPTTTTTTPEPTTTTTTPEPTTTTTTPEPTTTTTTPEPTTTTTTSEPTTTTITTTLEPTTSTTTTPEPTTEPTTTTESPEPTTTTTTPVPTTTSSSPIPTTASTTIEEDILPITKPNTPPPTDCDKDDLDCIIDETGDVKGWFDCPKRYGHFAHGSSRQLFIHCDNWRPFVKKCADHTHFSPEYLVCVWGN